MAASPGLSRGPAVGRGNVTGFLAAVALAIGGV